MIISKRELRRRIWEAYNSVPAQKHLKDTIRLAASDPEYAMAQVAVLVNYIEAHAVDGWDF